MIHKDKNGFKIISTVILIAGLIIFTTGFYYAVIKAGIPYQDPPLELQIQYEVNTRIGQVLTKCGFLTALAGGIFQSIIRKILK